MIFDFFTLNELSQQKLTFRQEIDDWFYRISKDKFSKVFVIMIMSRFWNWVAMHEQINVG